MAKDLYELLDELKELSYLSQDGRIRQITFIRDRIYIETLKGFWRYDDKTLFPVEMF